MVFPDQSHINHVRDALWKRSVGGASVMVGAGFSRNAEKARPDAHDSPTWHDLAKAMYEKLYPQDDDGSRQSAIAATSGSGNWVRLAQEYEAAFGRGDLHRLIRKLVRDDDFKPGDMHSRLLRLPWRDVLTTNWDTLLERTRPSVVERAYSVVRNIDEIPLASRPRIVKLHGSLPAHFPLVFTEEDYRTYPVEFAPFVNTTQQAMMETVLCLIGFSGDDPNFLHWSGWVRDNLGRSAPKIYLAGWLNLSPHRRRMLEDRNVVPIDLYRHPKSRDWPEHLRHRYATDWLLHTLEYGCPYDVSNWPSPSKPQVLRHPELLEPIERKVFGEPKDEPEPPSSEGESANLTVAVRELLSIWSHNRKMYPGWLIIPADKQPPLSVNTERWEPLILRSLPDLEPVDRLNAIRESIWRREILMEPISQNLEAAAQAVLREIDCQNRAINGAVDTKPDWAIIREAWLLIALALVTAARQRFDRDTFDGRIDSLLPFRNDNRDVVHRIHHERCLWSVNSLDYRALENQLKDWHIENCDPVWMMRKSALLFEMGYLEDANELIVTTLTTIRENPGDDRSIAGPSRESWSLYSASKREDLGHETGPWRRWEELTPLKCNAPAEKRRYAEAIRDTEKNMKGPSFDLGVTRGREIVISNAEYYQWIAARRAVRLTEIAGLPPSTKSGIATASDILGLAADKLFQHEPELAVLLALRTMDYDGDKRLNVTLSRAHVAAMSKDSVTRLARICIDAVEFSLPRIADSDASKRNVFWTERLRVTMEALSRFSVRLDPEMVESIFGRALQWYGNRKIAWDFLLANPVRSILTRSWEALPEQNQRECVLDVLSAPIVGMDDFSTSTAQYPDPGYLLTNDLTVPDRATDESRWQEMIDFLARGLRVGGEARKRASVRISWENFHNLLVNSEKYLVAHALWGDNYTVHNDLPAGTDIFDWAYLLLPEPEPGIAEERFRRKWLNTEISVGEDPLHIDDILWHVGSAISNLKIHKRPLTFSDQEREHLATLVARWAETPVRHLLHVTGVQELMFQERRNGVRRAILGLQSVLLEVRLSEPISERLYEKVQNLNESDISALCLVAGLINALPRRFDDIVLSMRKGLSSDDTSLAEDAAEGLWFWLRISSASTAELRPPPTDLIREIGMVIAARRKTFLGRALQIAKWVFSDGEPEHRDAIGELASQGLGYLAQELRYDGSHDPDDVPLLRWGCTHLALAMAQNGFNADPAVASWVESAENDPLPEVRYAKRPAGERPDDAVSNTPPVSDRPE